MRQWTSLKQHSAIETLFNIEITFDGGTLVIKVFAIRKKRKVVRRGIRINGEPKAAHLKPA